MGFSLMVVVVSPWFTHLETQKHTILILRFFIFEKVGGGYIDTTVRTQGSKPTSAEPLKVATLKLAMP